jgi:hypothetical protein
MLAFPGPVPFVPNGRPRWRTFQTYGLGSWLGLTAAETPACSGCWRQMGDLASLGPLPLGVDAMVPGALEEADYPCRSPCQRQR